MTNEKANELNKAYLDLVESTVSNTVVFKYDASDEAEVVKEYNEIYSKARKQKDISVKLSQSANEIVLIKKGKPEAPADVVEPKKWPTPAVELPEIIQELQPEGDCETPEDCEDGCKGDCEDGFDGENLT